MGVGDVYTIASSIDGNWLAWSITYYFWDVIGLGFLVLVFGGILGATVQYYRLNKRLKNEEKLKEDLNSCKIENAELAKKNASLSDETSSLKAKIQKLENPKLTEKELTEYVSKFPDAQKDILAEIYEAGGSIEAEALDSALMTLASAGLISVPPLMAPGTYCTWSLKPEINDLITRHPEVVESKQAKQLKEREEKKNELTDYIKHLDHNSKVVLWAVYTSDDGFNFKDYDSEYDNDYILEANTELIKFKNLDLIDYEYIDTDKRKWSMTDLGAELIEENHDVFKYIENKIKESK
ncbi:unknown [Cryptobacterium sp. CAG:338]|nr:unknown [Cryptobacterium sp. CAG:338]